MWLLKNAQLKWYKPRKSWTPWLNPSLQLFLLYLDETIQTTRKIVCTSCHFKCYEFHKYECINVHTHVQVIIHKHTPRTDTKTQTRIMHRWTYIHDAFHSLILQTIHNVIVIIKIREISQCLNQWHHTAHMIHTSYNAHPINKTHGLHLYSSISQRLLFKNIQQQSPWLLA